MRLTQHAPGFTQSGGAAVASGRHLRARASGAILSLGVGSSSFTMDDAIVGYAPPSGWTLAGDRLERAAGSVRTQIEWRGEELEQAWRFDAPPASGELDVRVTLAGLAFTGRGANGLLFRGSRAADSVRYGDATWIDARGVRTAVPAQFESGAVHLHVPADLLARSSYPAVLDPVVSPAVMVDPSPPALLVGGARDPLVAFGGGTYFATWTDDRGTSGPIVQVADFFGSDGKPSSRAGFAIPTANSAAFDGTQFVVIGGRFDLRFARVSASGGTLDPAGIHVATAASNINATALAGSPSASLAVWVDSADSVVRYARVTTAGTVLDVEGVAIAGSNAANIAAVWNGAAWLVLWQDSIATIHAVRVGTDGKLIDASPKTVASPADAHQLRVAFGSTSGMALVATLGGLVAVPIGADGAPTGTSKTIDPGYTNNSAIGWDGTGFRVAFSDGSTTSDVKGMRIDTAGGTLSAADTIGSAAWAQELGALACSPTDCLAAWKDGRNNLPGIYGEIYAGRVTPAGALPDTVFGVLLSGAAAAENGATATFVGSQVLVQWTDVRVAGEYANLRARVLGVDGSFAGPAFATFAGGFRSSLASDGVRAMSSFAKANAADTQLDLFTGRISTSTSSVLDPGGIDSGNPWAGNAATAIAWNGSEYLAAYTSTSSLAALRLGADGKTIGSPVVLKGGAVANSPTVASDGTDFLTGWMETGGKVFTARVSAAGVVSAAVAVSSATGGRSNVQIAYGTSTYLAVWVDFRDSLHPEIYGTFIDHAGAVVGPEVRITNSALSKSSPRVAWDGYAFIVTYAEGVYPANDIRATWVGSDGRVLGPTLDVTNDVLVPKVPSAVVADSAGHRAVVWSSIAYGTLGGEEVFAATITGAANGKTCAASADCASGFCVDGHCCGSACTEVCGACDVPGKVGECVPVPATDGVHHGTRSPCGGLGAGTSCGMKCDGIATASCKFPPIGTVSCGTASCVAGFESHVSTCDGAGACGDVKKSCGAFACDTTRCKTTCATNADCATGAHCDATGTCQGSKADGSSCDADGDCSSGHCVGTGVGAMLCCSTACPAGNSCGHGADPTKWVCTAPQGEECSTGVVCASGHCVDGVCCNSVCTDQCQACDLPGSVGTCTPVVSDKPHGSRPACDASTTGECGTKVCAGDKDPTKCVGFLHGPSDPFICKPSSCSGSVFTPASTCDGSGGCMTETPQDCGSHACLADGCAMGACSKDDDCFAPKFHCISGACVGAQATCSMDGFSSVASADMKVTSCSPYLCKPEDGSCGSSCMTTANCHPGFECDVNNRCVPASTPPPADSGGCNCHAAPSGSSSSLSLALVALLVAGVEARRRSR